MRSHVNLLGILHLVWGGMGLLLGGALLLLAFGAAAIARTAANDPLTAAFTAVLFVMFAAALGASGWANAWAGRAIRRHHSRGGVPIPRPVRDRARDLWLLGPAAQRRADAVRAGCRRRRHGVRDGASGS